MITDDAVWKPHKDIYLQKMPKSVLQSNWAYNTVQRNVDGSYKTVDYQTYVILDEAGFSQVPTSSAYLRWYNSLETMLLSKEHIAPERLVGHMTASWHFTTQDNIYTLLNDALRFGNAKKEVYPED